MGVDHENRVPHDRYVHNDCDDADRTSVAYQKSLGIQDAAEYFQVNHYNKCVCSDKQRDVYLASPIVNHVTPLISAAVS